MSITAAVARVSEIEAMLGQAGGATAPAATPATSFDQQLQQASAAGPGLGASLAPAVAGTGSGGDGPFKAEIDAAAQKYGLDPAVLRGLIHQESNFDPNARSGAGAVGLTQLMPGTAASLATSASSSTRSAGTCRRRSPPTTPAPAR